jgi:hypothetical protein
VSRCDPPEATKEGPEVQAFDPGQTLTLLA